MVIMFRALLFIMYITNSVCSIAHRMTNLHRNRDEPEDIWDNIEMLLSCSKVGQLFGRFAIAFGIRGIISLIGIFGLTFYIIEFIPILKQISREISTKSNQKIRIVIMTWLLLRN